MGKFNLGDFLNKEIFNQRQFKEITKGISTISGGIIDYAKNMATNMLKMSTNLSSFMSTSYFPYIILGIGGVFILFKLKVI